MRGRLIFPFLAELRRLDTHAMSTQTPGYDEDFKEPALLDTDGDGAGDAYRQAHAPARVPRRAGPLNCETRPRLDGGVSPAASIGLASMVKDLEQRGLVDASSGEALIRNSDRLSGLFDTEGTLVWSVRTPPGLYVTEARPAGFGLFRRRPRRNLLIVSFADRPAGR